MPEARVQRKLLAFIDGFNLYYGLLKARPDLRWLNVRKMVKIVFPNDEIVGIKYFTARVDDDGRKPPSSKRQRQDAYCAALASVDVEVIDGRLEYREKECGVSHCTLVKPCFYRSPVEKMTDVNLALNVVEDVSRIQPNVALIISADTDLMPAMVRVRRIIPKGLKQVLIPCSESAYKDRRVDAFGLNGWVARRLTEQVIKDSQFPESFQLRDGTLATRPAQWRISN